MWSGWELKNNITPMHLFYALIRSAFQLHCERSLRESEWQNFVFLPQQRSSLSKIKFCCTGENLLPLDTVTSTLQFLR